VYARTTTIQAQTSSIDDGIAHVRDEIMPAVQAIDGCVGMSLLVDRQSGRCIATTAWESEEAMHASAEKASQLRDRATQRFQGNVENIEQWEIATLHRDHRSREGACTRATWIKGDPARIDENIEFYRTSVLPSLEDLEGFCSASLLIDRASGRAVASTTFDSREAVERNRQQADAMRDERTREAGVEITDEGEFDLAIAHLRVPEMA
jgi:heme-degrading monooxygenase HmoA